MTKQLINLIGIVTSIGILAAGVLLFAMPFFTTAQATWAQAAGVAGTNSTQQIALDALVAQSTDMETLTAEVSSLRTGVPATAQGDDLVELAALAAEPFGAVVRSVQISTPEAFTGRGTTSIEGEEPAAPVEEPAGAAAAAPETGDADAASAAIEAATGPQQVTVTIEYVVGAPSTSILVLEALRAGGRLVSIDSATYANSAEGDGTLTVVLHAFYSPEA